jgi:hypothetical protein
VAVAGRTIVFRVAGTTVCSATTDSAGVATCETIGVVIGPETYIAAFAGDTDYLPSSATGQFVP